MAGSTNPAAPNATLTSLAPAFVEERHGTYLRHLNSQVANLKNLNIALTGRYGAGKSSILDEFEKTHGDDTVRLGISTLDPATPDSKLTNRLQKEIVKQLLYQAPAGRLRLSRFNRITRRNPFLVFAQSLALVLAAFAVVGLPGWLPQLAGTGEGHSGIQSTAIWGAFGLVLTGLVTAARTWVLDRQEVTSVSAGGASVTLSAKNATYFDEYIDELVYFFDEISPKYVIFEDLDRFEDPHIFEALRELNTLLNSTQKRRKSNEPVQFIYAIKDSLFEKLGQDSGEGDDDATEETKRANRTKFFEVVIPVVPFISHRNARELLSDELSARGVTNLDRRLVDLVARRTTDMRLLHNICNEYVVFHERLLGSIKVAPGLTPDKLFALVAYKNFHLKDFELIARRESNLDALYDRSRDLITGAISDLQQQRRTYTNARARTQKTAPVAAKLGDRITRLGKGFLPQSQWAGWPHIYFKAGSTIYAATDARKYALWKDVADTGNLDIMASSYPDQGGRTLFSLDREDLESLLPEALTAGQWATIDATETRKQIENLDAGIAYLRGAGFVELVREPGFKRSRRGEGTLATIGGADDDADWDENDMRPFARDVDNLLTSELARDLVKQGYIDRNFTLYAAQFYGHFSGVDVATFLVQNANPGVMEINYSFSGPDAIKNLLSEAPTDFTSSPASFNLEVLDYLLDNSPTKAAEVVQHMLASDALRDDDSDASRFLAAFVNSDLNPERLIAALARRGWRGAFGFVVDHPAVPDDRRVALADAAFLAAASTATYEVEDSLRDFIVNHYATLSAFHDPQTTEATKVIAAIALRAGVTFPDISNLGRPLRATVVRERQYPITADNLRSALGITGAVPLDIMQETDDVWRYCLDAAPQYVDAVTSDPDTAHTVEGEQCLIDILTQVADSWTDGWISLLLDHAERSAMIDELSTVPESTWPTLARHVMFAASLANVDAYRTKIGEIDEPLAALLTGAQTIATTDSDDEPTRMAIAIAILISRATLSSAELRVKLVVSLDLDDYVDPTLLQCESGPLLAELLKHRVVDDTADAFEAFARAGWPTIESAIAESTGFTEFANRAILSSFIPEVLASPVIANEVKMRVMANVDTFVAEGDTQGLMDVGKFALHHRIALPVEVVERIAQETADVSLTVRLTAAASLNANSIVRVFTHLPVPYSYFATKSQQTFQVDDDEPHRVILDVLDAAHIASSTKVRLKPRRNVILNL
ncbi:MAG: hypothetical protein JWN84_1136 [Nocardioides sp.]|nr:hypothetical protein [Nocardioides sp.]